MPRLASSRPPPSLPPLAPPPKGFWSKGERVDLSDALLGPKVAPTSAFFDAPSPGGAPSLGGGGGAAADEEDPFWALDGAAAERDVDDAFLPGDLLDDDDVPAPAAAPQLDVDMDDPFWSAV